MDGRALPLPEAVREPAGAGLRRVESRFWLPRPRWEVFEHFADARNLRQMTPPWLSFRIRTPMPVEMGEGTRIDYWMLWHGLPIPWRSRVTVWDPPRVFTYEQARGPYRRFVHEHRYIPQEGGTLVVDRAWFSLWTGGLFAEWVETELQRVFDHREQTMAELFRPLRRHA